MADADIQTRRQVIYWQLLASAFGQGENAPNVGGLAHELVAELGLPDIVLDPAPSIDTVLRRYPELKCEFDGLEQFLAKPDGADESIGDTSLRRGLVYSKLLLNVFGPNAQRPVMTAADYNQWCQDVAQFEQCFGFQPGQLRNKGAGPSSTSPDGASGQPGGQEGGGGTGMGPRLSEEQLQAGLQAMEADIIQRMSLREVLSDDTMAAQLTPSMALTEQLLLDKANLSGTALKNARQLIKTFVDKLAAVLRSKVERAVKGKIDRSVPPKRVFRNLDLKRTVWKNLTNYNAADRRLYVDRLFYKPTASKQLPKKLIVVADQSGSMVDAMVQTAILASIFASIPKVDVHLIAFDTEVLDLTPWVHEPFETLMRTNLGGGNDGPKAMRYAQPLIAEPRNTTVVWISDFYEFNNDQPLFELIKAVKESGARFIPVGSLKGSGHFDVNPWFRDKLKQIGLPVLSGGITKLIGELKDLL
jgi:hypothetical protein